MADRTNIYQQVTDQIIAQLENGTAPWRKPWATIGCGMPSNVASRRAYRGVNTLLLWAAAEVRGYESSLWGTFNQWQHLGGHVEKGQKGTKIVFWRVVEKSAVDQRTGEETDERQFFCRQYTVFNLAQCGGDALNRFRIAHPVREFDDFGPAEEAIAATGASIRHGGNRAFYDPTDDCIGLPIKGAFASEATYYSTALHELAHWSGHETRLNRHDKLKRFGDESYAAEELVAELSSSFLTAALGVPNAPIQDNAAYLKSWLSVLRADNKAIFTASTAASAAADYILAFSNPVESEEVEDEAMVA